MSNDLIYAAGFMDAAGYVTLMRLNKGSYRVPYVQISNTDSDLVWFFQLTFGGRAKRRVRLDSNHSDVFDWFLTYNAALKFLEEIRPYMRNQKKTERMDLILEGYKAVTRRNGKYTEEQRKAKLAFEDRVMGVKMTGT